MFWSLFFGILGVAFALFGLVCAIELIVEACFPQEQIFTVVEIREQKDAEMLDLWLAEARRTSMRSASARVGVLLSPTLLQDGRIPQKMLDIMERYGAECYLCE